MTVARAIEKIAGHASRPTDVNGGEIICHRCGTQCVPPAGARLEETLCIGCVRRLVDAERRRDGWAAIAVRAVADWADKSAVRGPGYGLVTCPHCDTECVVEVGETTRTGCAACLRPLGGVPLVRADLAARDSVAAASPAADDDQILGRYALCWPAVADDRVAIASGRP